MKGLRERNIGSHHLGSRGYGGKRSIWAKEDAERESLGIPDPLAEFTVKEICPRGNNKLVIIIIFPCS